jgi:hypothetical protein
MGLMTAFSSSRLALALAFVDGLGDANAVRY